MLALYETPRYIIMLLNLLCKNHIQVLGVPPRAASLSSSVLQVLYEKHSWKRLIPINVRAYVLVSMSAVIPELFGVRAANLPEEFNSSNNSTLIVWSGRGRCFESCGKRAAFGIRFRRYCYAISSRACGQG